MKRTTRNTIIFVVFVIVFMNCINLYMNYRTTKKINTRENTVGKFVSALSEEQTSALSRLDPVNALRDGLILLNFDELNEKFPDIEIVAFGPGFEMNYYGGTGYCSFTSNSSTSTNKMYYGAEITDDNIAAISQLYSDIQTIWGAPTDSDVDLQQAETDFLAETDTEMHASWKTDLFNLEFDISGNKLQPKSIVYPGQQVVLSIAVK